MTKHFCDRCGYEITFTDSDSNHCIKYGDFYEPTVSELCTSCLIEFRKFLEDPSLHYDCISDSWFGGRNR